MRTPCRMVVALCALALVASACSSDDRDMAEDASDPTEAETTQAPLPDEPDATEAPDEAPTPADEDDGPVFRTPDIDLSDLPVLGGGGDEATDEPSELVTDEPAADEPTDELSPSPSPSGEAVPVGTLPDEWYVDSNGNSVPDFLEEEMGWDPQEPTCAGEIDCGDVQGIDDLAPVQQAVMLMLDASGSMAEQLEDGQKMDLAKEAVEYYATGTPDVVDLGFMVYGHQGSMDPADTAESCEGVETLGALGEVDHESVPALLEEFSPTGFTPIAGALDEAGRQFEGREGDDNRVILVSDGLETCGGDPVAAARRLQTSGIEVTVDVIAFDVPTDEQQALADIADAGGGEFLVAGSGSELRQRVEDQVLLGWSFLETRGCVLIQSVSITTCLARSPRLVSGAFTDAAREGDWTDEQTEEIAAREQEAIADLRTQSALFQEATGEQSQEYERSLEEARERVREKYGDEVSLADRSFCWEAATLAAMPATPRS